jgi:hypothetical protein
MHSAHPTIGVSISQVARHFESPILRPRKVSVIAGPNDRPLAEMAKRYLQEYLGDDYPLEWNWIPVKAKSMRFDDISAADTNCLFLFGHTELMDEKALDHVYDYWQCGGSLAAVRVADFALHGKARFCEDIFGGEYHYEHFPQSAQISLLQAAGHHPLTRGVQPFISRGGLHHYDLSLTEATPIMFGAVAGETFPVTWVRSKLGRRIFATTLGVGADFRHPYFLRMIANAVTWTAR